MQHEVHVETAFVNQLCTDPVVYDSALWYVDAPVGYVAVVNQIRACVYNHEGDNGGW